MSYKIVVLNLQFRFDPINKTVLYNGSVIGICSIIVLMFRDTFQH